ncbi:MAG: hypothetical protein II822_11445, partial [Prevotella sp.]|nr:hypothetical protein [Prevotella sp.]
MDELTIGETIATTYTITDLSGENGTLTFTPASSVAEGTEVTITINPAEGYRLKSGTLAASYGESTPVTITDNKFTMPAGNVSVTAEFEKVYTITKAETTNGTITAKVGEEGVTEAAEGATVVITATPSEGYQLASLTYTPEGESAVDIKSTMQFTMPAKAVTIAATFEEIPATTYAITKAEATNGSFTVSSETAAADATVTITTSPATGYEVDAVTTNVNGTVPAKSGTDDNVYTFTMPTKAVTVTVTFKQINYAINGLGDVTISETKVGTVSVGEEKTTATYGETVTITATPEEGYQLTALKYNDGSEDHEFTLSSTPYTFEMPASNVTITATFELIPVTTYGVTLPTGLTGGTVASDKAEAAKDDKVTLTVTPDMTYELEDLKVNNGDVTLTLGNDGKYSFIMPEGAVSISATFTAMSGLSAADGYVRGDGTNAGNSYTSPIQIVRKEGGAQMYGYITFPLNIPTGKVVKSATLRLTAKRVKGDRYINVYALDGNTAETSTYTSLSEKIANPGTAIFSNYKVEGGNMDMTTDNIGNYNTISKWQNTFDLTAHLKSLGNVSSFGLLFERVLTSAADEIHFFTREQMPFVNIKDDNDVNIAFSKSLKRSDLVPQLTVTYGDPEYDVSIGTFAGGTVEADKTTVTAGETVTLTITPTDSHYQLTGLTVGGQAVTATLQSNGTYTYSFTMPANDVTVEATFQAVASSYSVWNATTETGYGSLNAAVDALSDADTDIELQVYQDQTLTKRVTWNKAHALTITPMKDITITGHNDAMWLLANVNNAVLNIGSTTHTITLDGESKTFDYDVAKYENTATLALTNVTFQNFNLNSTGHLVGSNANEGQIILDKVTFKNCQNPENGFINKLRVTNDRLVLRGYLNQESCSGTTIYAASETKTSGTTGRIKIDDSSFTASNTITIEWPGTKEAGIVVAIGTSTANYGKFALTDGDWVLERKASNGDLIMALPTFSIDIDNMSNGEVTASTTAATEGETVTLTVTPDEGYRLVSLTVTNGSTTVGTTATSDNTYTFEMPKGDVTVSASFEAIPASEYSVWNKTAGKGYSSLNAAVSALSSATGDIELEVNEDQTLTGRLTWSKAFALTITPTKDITIKGHTNQMWLLANADNGSMTIGNSSHSITLDGQENKMGAYPIVKREKKASITLKNVKFQNFDLNASSALCQGANADGVMTLEDVTVSNCKNPAMGLFYNERVVNDKVVLKGYLNIDTDCEGTAIYALAEYKSDTQVNGRIKVDDDNFTASNPITIDWASNNAEKSVMIEGVSV